MGFLSKVRNWVLHPIQSMDFHRAKSRFRVLKEKNLDLQDEEIEKVCKFVERNKKSCFKEAKKSPKGIFRAKKDTAKKDVASPFTIEFSSSGEVSILLRTKALLGKGKQKHVSKSIDYNRGVMVADAVLIKGESEKTAKRSQVDQDSINREVEMQKRFGGDQEFAQIESVKEYEAGSVTKVRIRQELFKGSLLSFLSEKQRLDKEELNIVMLDLINALIKIEEKGLVYQDGKPANFLYTHDEAGRIRAAVGDFGGLSEKNREGKAKFIAATLLTISPETGKVYKEDKSKMKAHLMTTADDVWSWGISFYFMLLKEELVSCDWLQETEYEGYTSQNYKSLEPKEKNSYEYLIWRMTNPDPEERIKPKEILKCFKEIVGEEKFKELMEARGYSSV